MPGRCVAGTLTLVVRLALHGKSFDLFGDEVIYADLGRSVVNGGFPRFYGAFFLHGPGFFYLEAGWARLFGNATRLDGPGLRDAHAQRAARGGDRGSPGAPGHPGRLTMVGRSGGIAVCPGPVLHRQNDRVLLETALMLWVMLGYLVFPR